MTPDDVATALKRHPRMDMPALPGRTNHLKTGVLVPLVWGEALSCIVTVRTAHLRNHGGEVCFPGGRPDPTDPDLQHTALREAREELGIERARVLGELSSIPLYTSDYRIQPFVAAVPQQPFVINRAEVAEVIVVELETVLRQPHIDGIPWTHEGVTSLSPAFELRGPVMFGATAHTFYELLIVLAPLLGRELPELKAGRFEWSDVLP